MECTGKALGHSRLALRCSGVHWDKLECNDML